MMDDVQYRSQFPEVRSEQPDELMGNFAGCRAFQKGLVKSLVMQINHDGLLRVMHIPEDSLAVLIEGSCSNHSGHTGSGHPHAMPPSACDLRVGSDACDVDERYFEAAL